MRDSLPPGWADPDTAQDVPSSDKAVRVGVLLPLKAGP